MEEKDTNTIIGVLAEAVRKLRVDVMILEGENKRLREKIAIYESPLQEVKKNDKEF